MARWVINTSNMDVHDIIEMEVQAMNHGKRVEHEPGERVTIHGVTEEEAEAGAAWITSKTGKQVTIAKGHA